MCSVIVVRGIGLPGQLCLIKSVGLLGLGLAIRKGSPDKVRRSLPFWGAYAHMYLNPKRG